MIDLSIIVPHYNDFERLLRLLESIPNENNIEILIIDDNSESTKFDIKNIKKKYHDKNIVVLKNYKDKRGAGACRNIGIENATGKWILFADSDDFFTNNFFKVVKKYFKSDYQIVFFYPTSFDEISRKVSDRHIPYVRILENNLQLKSKSTLELKYNFHVPWSKLYQKKFINEYNISFEESIAANDVLFSIYSGFYLKNFSIDNKEIYVVTKNKGSLTQNTNIEIHRARIKTTIERELFLKKVLSATDFKKIRASGRGFLLNTIIYKMGCKEFINTFKILRKNNIVFLELKLLNPVIIIKKIYIQFKRIVFGRKYRI